MIHGYDLRTVAHYSQMNGVNSLHSQIYWDIALGRQDDVEASVSYMHSVRLSVMRKTILISLLLHVHCSCVTASSLLAD